MNKTNEKRKECAKIIAQAEVDDDLEDVSAAGVVVPRCAADMSEVAEAIGEHDLRPIRMSSYIAEIGFRVGAIFKFK